jgi:hypothetical protein
VPCKLTILILQNTTIKLKLMFYISIFINFFYHEKFKVQINTHPLLFLLSPDFVEKNLKKFPLHKFLKKCSRKNFIQNFYCNKIYSIRIFYCIQHLFYNIYIIYFSYGPQGEGACRFLYRDNNMMQVICKLLFVWRRKLVLSSSSRLCQT